MDINVSSKSAKRNGSILLQGSYTTGEMIYHLKVECNELKMYIINPKTSTKTTEQRFIANKPTNETKLNHKKYSINPKEGKKMFQKGINNWWDRYKASSKMTDLNEHKIINTKYVSHLQTPISKQRFPT